MINEVQLVNWKAHKDTKLQFSKGTNVLIGVMGAGKSSVLDAISYALFGTYPALQHKRNSVSSIITSRPAQENEATVRLSFSVDKDSYVVERKIALNGSAKATLTKNGAYLQSQPQRVTEEIERILKVEYDLFSRAVYSEQNRLDYFLELRASERKEQIDELLGLDKFGIAIENATTLINRLRDTIEDQEKQLSGFDVARLNEQRDALVKERDELVAGGKKIEKELEAVEDQYSKAESELKALKEQYNKKMLVSREIAEINSKLSVIKNEITSIEEKKFGSKEKIKEAVENAKIAIKRLNEEEAKMRESERDAQKKVATYSAAIAQINEKLAERQRALEEIGDKKIEALEEKLSKKVSETRSLEKELASWNAQIEENGKWLEELEKHITKCPVCERDLPEDMKNRLLTSKQEFLRHANAIAADLDKKAKEANREAESIRDEIGKLKVSIAKLNSLTDLDKQLADNKHNLEEAAAAENDIRKAYAKNKEALNAANANLSELSVALNALERLESYKSEEGRLILLLKEREGALSTIDADEKKVDSLQKVCTELNAKASKIRAESEANKKYIQEREYQIDDKNAQIDKINAAYEEIKSKRRIVENLLKFKNALSETQGVMRSKLINAINSVMQEIWPEIYPYGDYTNITLDGTSSDYILKVKTYANGKENWESVDAVASGGERSIACLAMRVAFAMVLVPNLRWIILDEPTHNIDRQGLSRFVQVFNDMLPKIIDQVFIITHDETLKQASNAKIYLLTRDKDAGGFAQAQEL